jgi:hypothetical protein
MTVRINKQKINLREKLTEFEDKVNFDEVVRGLGEYDGNVGIGTTNPGYNLHIAGGTPALKLEGTQPRIWLSENDQTDLNTLIRNNNSRFQIDTATDNDVFIANRLTILNGNGNVGIGTTNPVFVVGGGLEIEKPGVATLRLQNVGDGNSFELQAKADTVDFNDYNDKPFVFKHNTTEQVRIDSNGNVGIGTTDPGTNKLYVSGNIYANGTITPSSDDRVKHNEQNIVGAIETLGKITPKKYIKTADMYEADHDFELDTNGNPIDANGEPVEHSIEAGVIAQQILEVPELAFMVSPEGVDEDGNVTSPHGLNYNSLFTYAIAAIQEQQSIIEDLKSRIETLESK